MSLLILGEKLSIKMEKTTVYGLCVYLWLERPMPKAVGLYKLIFWLLVHALSRNPQT